ncbi:MAG: M48 family metallopeptidase [Magnetococcales bacterium]|nr:M48 family metallopeptidase [Magnetococcales bacterium]
MHSVIYGDARIEFQLSRSLPRRGKKVSIHVHPDGAVQVEAPEETSDREVREAVRKRARWILRQCSVAEHQREHVTPRRYVSGESHFYLGRRHLLKVRVDPDIEAGVKMVHGRLEISCQSENPGVVKDLLKIWYRQRSKEQVQRRLDAYADRLPWLDGPPPWKLVRMEKQWGSCSPKGRISISPHLIKAPRECVDYVVLHELCHLKEHNHSERFYRLLDRLMPDWKLVKEKLDGMAELLLND